MAFLQQLDGSRTFPLRPRVTLIGRHPACDISVGLGQVSGQHAIILNLGGRHYIEDLQSRNGTFVNGRRIDQRTPLNGGDRIEVPGLALEFREGDLGGIAPSARTTLTWPGEPAPGPPPLILSSFDVAEPPRPEIAPEAKLRAVLEMVNTLGPTLTLEAVLPKILESLFTIFPHAARGFIIMRDPTTGRLSLRAARQRGSQVCGNVQPLTTDLPPFSRTVIEHALASGKAILSSDAALDQRFRGSESIVRLGLCSIMCVPMMSQSGTPLGVIQIDTQESARVFFQEDLDVLLCASIQAARAIELAQLHEELRDLEAARTIQHSFLPERRPEVSGLRFFDHYLPAQHIGGDYFDYIRLPGNRLAVTLGDVAGKGISAALLMAQMSASARFCLATAATLPEAVRQLNLTLARAFGEDRFGTLVVLVFDLNRYSLTVANAGHPPPLLVGSSPGRVRPLGEEIVGLPLAGIDQPYEGLTLTLEPGEAVVCYTDGITEARNPEGHLYGMDRLRQVVQPHAGEVERLGAAILADLQSYMAGQPPHDDVTLVCVGRAR